MRVGPRACQNVWRSEWLRANDTARRVRWNTSAWKGRRAYLELVDGFHNKYALHRLARSVPEVRFRLFRDTVFHDAAPAHETRCHRCQPRRRCRAITSSG